MDIYFYHRGITFVWDENKARQNRKKHHIDFERAAQAFFDPFMRFVDATRSQEERDAIIGKAENQQMLFVVNIQFQDDLIRLISARPVSKIEEAYYYETFRA